MAELVAPLLTNSDPHIVDAASEGMARLGPAAAPFALRCLQAESKLQRKAAVCILEGLGACGAQAADSMLQHAHPEVRRAALRVLQRAAGIVAGFPGAAQRIGAWVGPWDIYYFPLMALIGDPIS